MIEVYSLANDEQTLALGESLARRLTQGTVFLKGDLGAGKTTLVRGWLHALGHAGAIKSPTYTLVEPYRLAGVDIYHFDLYRLSDPEELEMIGGRDYFAPDSLCLVEWPEKGTGMLPAALLTVELKVLGRAREAALVWSDTP